MLWINFAGLVLIGLILWWFWLYRPREAAQASDGVIEIRVKDGVYLPARIAVSVGKPVRLKFFREDASPCSETVVFHGLDISSELPLKQEKIVELNIATAGEYRFTCPMQMYTGLLIAR